MVKFLINIKLKISQIKRWKKQNKDFNGNDT